MKSFFTLLFVIFASVMYAQPVVPVIDPAAKAALRKLYLQGKSLGNRPEVFAKVGDSITDSKFFMIDVGCDVEVLGGYSGLGSTIRYFREHTFPNSYTESWCGVANSFSRDSISAFHGWTAADPLLKFSNPVSVCPPPNDNPLRCELSLLKPSIALVMYGTNDLELNALSAFRKNLTRVVQEIQIAGVIPVVSTIPPRLDSFEMGRRVESYNQVIREVAESLQAPLWNYWLALQGGGLVQHGIDNKGIHPNVYNKTLPAVFTSEGLRYGFNLRNLTALQVLQELRAVILNNAPADIIAPRNFALSPGKLRLSVQRDTIVKFFVRVLRHEFTAPITLVLEGTPAGITGSFVWNASGTGATLTLIIRSGVGQKDHLITITGTSGNLVRKTPFVLTVT